MIDRTTMKIEGKFPVQLDKNKNNVDRIPLEEKLRTGASSSCHCLREDKVQEISQLEEGLEVSHTYL